HLTDETPPSVWLSLAAYALGFALAGVLVGAVRRYPEFVGLCASICAVAVFVIASWLEGDAIRLMRLNHNVDCWSMLRNALGVDWELAWLVIVGGTGLFWGPVIGALHRLCSPRPHAKPNPEDELIYGEVL